MARAALESSRRFSRDTLKTCHNRLTNKRLHIIAFALRHTCALALSISSQVAEKGA
jgi:hypothetical protein